ncbi:Protein phosphatase 1 regulatory subunit 37 [Taenia crassiceps]|uniref:Protein phosphatase 1 regulatory subunit 37 n=1 Tax=Taenia crassiceps TaxID=6207 RepID=A0ABR4QH81_9CEST
MTTEKFSNFVFPEERGGVGGGERPVVTKFTNSIIPVPQLPSPPRPKCVRFPEDEAQLATVLHTSGDEPWRVDLETPNYVIVDAYAEACLQLDCRPLSCIIEQLSKVSSPLAKTKIPAIILKGTQLTKEDLEALECIFKYCQTYHLSFENTGLNNESLSYLLEALDYYAPCSELCLARNRGITGVGIERIANFIAKYPQLNWLDLRGISLNPVSGRHLSWGLTSQRDEARKLVTKFLGVCTGQELVNSDSSRDARFDVEAFQRTFSVFSYSPTSAEVHTLSGALQCLPPLCLRGLHLGETRLSGPALLDVTAAIRVAGHLRDLRLPGNKLCAHDIELMTPLLRYHPALQVLDLSHNDLGDEGYQLLANALLHPSYPSNLATPSTNISPTKPQCNLRRLYLTETGLRPAGAKHFATCLPALVCLSHLELSNNPNLGCQGVLALRSGLQAYTRRRLVYLGLAHCGLACQGAIALAEILGDGPRALRRIDLTGNYVAEAGLMAFSKSIPLCGRLVQLQGLEDNRPIQRSTIGGSGLVRPKTTNSIHQKGWNGKSVSVSPVVNETPTRLSLFKLPRSASLRNDASESNQTSIWNRVRSANRDVILLEPSQLSLDLLQTIHSQLAANVDKRVTSCPHHNHGCEANRREGELRFFRGYVRFPATNGMRREPDPRHLCGDTSESDVDDDSESNLSPEKTPSPARPEATTVQTSFLGDNDLCRTDCVK